MFGTFSRPLITATLGLISAGMLAVGGAPAALAAPGPRAPHPAVPDVPQVRAPGPGDHTLPIAVPFDDQLAGALKLAKQLGGDKVLVEILQAVMGAAGQISPKATSAIATQQVPGVKTVDAAADPLTLLRQAGVQPLSPSVAPFCQAPTPQNPLGLVNASASAIPGPWPLRTANPLHFLPFPLPGVTLPDPNIVKDEHTAFAFIPADATIAKKRGTMRVAWFNTATMRGGINDLTPLSDTNPMLKLLPGLAGVRLVPVNTGKGTILAAVYGTAGAAGNRECVFLPSVGVVNS